MLKTGSQELQPRAQMHTRQSGEAAMALAKPEAGRNAFTFRVSGAPDLASSSKHRAEMPASKPQPTRLAGASPAREVKQPATTTTTAEICAVVDASASLEAMPRRLSVGQGQLMSDPVVSMEECSERLERLLQHVHRANEEKAALKALKLPTTPKKPTLARSSTTSSSNGEADGSRRRAATVGSAERGQNASVRIQLRLEELRARRLARKGDARKAAAKDDSVAMPMSHPTSAIQNKVERLRTRREAREEKDRRAADSCNAAFPMSSSLPVKSKPRANIDSIATREMYRKNSYSGSETATDCTSGADEDGDSTKRSSGFLPMLLDESFKESLVGKGFSNKELSVRMRGSMDRTAPPPHRCDTLVDSTPISEGGEALDQDPKHALSLVKKSDADEQVLSHVVNSSSPSTEQKIAQLIAENRLLKHHVSEARKAIAALTRVVVRMQ
ncbi:hypothetical protein GGI23_006344 [Coemansia sp. RSA 2559]|nr:hypothetical protein GGI23_006344 [Coemansia sp. RSA 2559]